MMMATLPGRPNLLGYSARAKWATVRIEADDAVYVGRVYVPETKKRLSDILCDERPFLLLTEVSVNDADKLEPFVALNKRHVRTVRVLHEGEADVVSISKR
jgi:hypothetical protein